MLENIAGRLLEVLVDYRRLHVTVHKGYFAGPQPSPEVCFVTVVNRSRSREIEVTHVWFQGATQIPVIQAERPLPKRLRPDESWTTWIITDNLPEELRAAPFKLGRVRLSSGSVVNSKRAGDLPSSGVIPGG